METLTHEIGEVRAQIHQLNDSLDRSILWTRRLLIAMWVSVIIAIGIAILVDQS